MGRIIGERLGWCGRAGVTLAAGVTALLAACGVQNENGGDKTPEQAGVTQITPDAGEANNSTLEPVANQLTPEKKAELEKLSNELIASIRDFSTTGDPERDRPYIEQAMEAWEYALTKGHNDPKRAAKLLANIGWSKFATDTTLDKAKKIDFENISIIFIEFQAYSPDGINNIKVRTGIPNHGRIMQALKDSGVYDYLPTDFSINEVPNDSGQSLLAYQSNVAGTWTTGPLINPGYKADKYPSALLGEIGDTRIFVQQFDPENEELLARINQACAELEEAQSS